MRKRAEPAIGQQHVARFQRREAPGDHPAPTAAPVAPDRVQAALDSLDARNWAARPDRVAVLRRALSGAGGVVRRALSAAAAFDPSPFTLPGPTGESDRLSLHPRGTVLCLGPEGETATAQAVQALAAGCAVVIASPGADGAGAAALRATGAPVIAIEGTVAARTLTDLTGLAGVAAAGGTEWTRQLRMALAARDGAILALETEVIAPARYVIERHLCIDTTAAGGNASLLASVS